MFTALYEIYQSISGNKDCEEGYAFLDLGLREQALNAFNRALAKSKNHSRALLGIALVKQEQFDFDGALQQFNLVLSSNPSEDLKKQTYFYYGMLLISRRQFDEAQDVFNKALVNKPFIVANLGKALVTYHKGESDTYAVEFINYIDKVLSANPNYLPALALKVTYFLDIGNYDQALKRLEELKKISDQNYILLHANFLFCKAKYDEAINLLENCALIKDAFKDSSFSTFSLSTNAFCILSYCQLAKRDFDQALNNFEEIIYYYERNKKRIKDDAYYLMQQGKMLVNAYRNNKPLDEVMLHQLEVNFSGSMLYSLLLLRSRILLELDRFDESKIVVERAKQIYKVENNKRIEQELALLESKQAAFASDKETESSNSSHQDSERPIPTFDNSSGEQFTYDTEHVAAVDGTKPIKDELEEEYESDKKNALLNLLDAISSNSLTIKGQDLLITCSEITSSIVNKDSWYTGDMVNLMLYCYYRTWSMADTITLCPALRVDDVGEWVRTTGLSQGYAFIPVNVPYEFALPHNKNHWVALIIDYQHGQLFYLDPAQKTHPSKTIDAIKKTLGFDSSIIENPINFQVKEQQEGWVRHCGPYIIEIFNQFAEIIKHGQCISGSHIPDPNVSSNGISLQTALSNIPCGEAEKIRDIRNHHIDKAYEFLTVNDSLEENPPVSSSVRVDLKSEMSQHLDEESHADVSIRSPYQLTKSIDQLQEEIKQGRATLDKKCKEIAKLETELQQMTDTNVQLATEKKELQAHLVQLHQEKNQLEDELNEKGHSLKKLEDEKEEYLKKILSKIDDNEKRSTRAVNISKQYQKEIETLEQDKKELNAKLEIFKKSNDMKKTRELKLLDSAYEGTLDLKSVDHNLLKAARNNYLQNVLHQAVLGKQNQLIKELLNLKLLDPIQTDLFGNPPVYYAFKDHEFDLVNLFLQHPPYTFNSALLKDYPNYREYDLERTISTLQQEIHTLDINIQSYLMENDEEHAAQAKNRKKVLENDLDSLKKELQKIRDIQLWGKSQPKTDLFKSKPVNLDNSGKTHNTQSSSP